jgi:long-subunit acyl-CoA synthetase (AMP-forming)
MILTLLPLFHAYGLIAAFLGPMAHGSSMCMQPSLKGPDILKSLAENPITFFPAVPLLWELIMDGIINKVRLESKLKFRLFMFFFLNTESISERSASQFFLIKFSRRYLRLSGRR